MLGRQPIISTEFSAFLEDWSKRYNCMIGQISPPTYAVKLPSSELRSSGFRESFPKQRYDANSITPWLELRIQQANLSLGLMLNGQTLRFGSQSRTLPS